MRVCRNWKKYSTGLTTSGTIICVVLLVLLIFDDHFFPKESCPNKTNNCSIFARMIFCLVRFTHSRNVDNLVGDLSGTHIKSTQKVAVLSGNIRTSVGQGSSRDHLVTMLPPIESWGNTYCTVPIPGNRLFKTFHILYPVNFFAKQFCHCFTFSNN